MDTTELEINLDRCEISIPNVENWNWKQNHLHVSNTRGDELFKDEKSIYLYFVSGKELEEWYYALKRSVIITSSVSPSPIIFNLTFSTNQLTSNPYYRILS